MLAFSSPLFSTTCGWPLEDLITQNLQQTNNTEAEANSYYSLLDKIQRDFAPDNSDSSGGATNGVNGYLTVTKKLNHNASERDRRKRVNDLYAFLRSMLPLSSDKKKKLSIPGTVSLALKYVPELQKEVEKLLRKKEKLLTYYSSTDVTRKEQLQIRNQRAKDATIQTISSVVCSVGVLEEKEVAIHLISSSGHTNKNKEIGFLSKALEYLEEEEDGLVLLSASTFQCFGEERFLNTLYFKMQDGHKVETETLKEKLFSFYEGSHHQLVCY